MGRGFAGRHLDHPEPSAKYAKEQHVKWEQVEDVFNKSSKKIFILAILDLVDLPSNIAITLPVFKVKLILNFKDC